MVVWYLNFTASDHKLAVAMEQGVIQVLNKILALGETISGKNGIGLTKKPFIEMELSPESVRLQMEIKRLFDPNLTLNPGKIFNWSKNQIVD